MKRVIFILTVVILSSLTALAQHPPDTLWTNTYTYGYQSFGYSVEQTTDGGFIASGMTTVGFIQHPYLVKTDANGNSIWERIYPANAGAGLYEVHQTSDGGYVVVGGISPSMGEGYIYLIKTDADGDTIWTRTYGGENLDSGKSVQQTWDGGYIITGCTYYYENGDPISYILLLKTNANGDSLWMRTYDYIYGGGYSVLQNRDGDYVITGYAWEEGAYYGDVYLIKTDQDGDTLWTRTYGGVFNEVGRFVQQTSDGGYIIAGCTMPSGAGMVDVYLIKTDAEGDTLWTRTYGGYNIDDGYCVDQTFDGGYIITGYTKSFSTVTWADLYLIRTDEVGDTLWTCTFGDSGLGDVDRGYGVQQTTEGGFIVAGRTDSYTPDDSPRMWLIRLDSENIPSIEDMTIQISGDDVILNWPAMPAAEGYNIYRSLNPYFGISGMTPIATQTQCTFIDSNAVGGMYFYRVTVVY